MDLIDLQPRKRDRAERDAVCANRGSTIHTHCSEESRTAAGDAGDVLMCEKGDGG